jgi:hypothetical protein
LLWFFDDWFVARVSAGAIEDEVEYRGKIKAI